jgi:ferredoxin-NADP reductase
MTNLLERLSTPLDPDDFRSILGPLHTRRLQGVIESIRPLSSTAAEITIRAGRSWVAHTPGQHLNVGVDIDGVRHTRCYSLTSAPDRRGLISIAVQAKSDGLVSKHLVADTRAGDVVQLGAPDGDFTLPSAATNQILFITAGSGITPAIGMIRSLAQGIPSKDHHDVVILHHAPTRAASMFAAELDALADEHDWLRVVSVATREGGAHLDAARLGDMCPDWAERDTFACGPVSLLDFAVEHWSAKGHGQALHLERFVAPVSDVSRRSESTGGIVRFATSQVEATAAGDVPLLEVAEASGLLPASGCRMGICHTCTTRLDDGCVRDLRDSRRSEAGAHVQICVSVAEGDITLDL